ncbi:MAG: tetratricopeptide repeat protein [Thiobacillaceae bacterium]
MTKPVAAPEIFQIPLDQLDPAIVPLNSEPGTPEFEQAVITRYALRYAEKGWQAMVTVNDGYVRVLAIPQQGMDPKDYVQGLLRNGFLDDALPILQALDGMIADADIAYNLGICLSELGRTAESVEPLERCTRLDPDYANAWVGLGVAYTRLDRTTEAMGALKKAVQQQPTNSFAQRNLGALLSKVGKHAEALPHFRQAVAQAPNNPAAAFGLGQCLHTLGGEHRKEADPIYSDLIKRFPDSPVAEMARQALTQLAQDSFRDNVDGAVRMDAVFYMMDALDRFAGMSKTDIGHVTMEVALLGRQGLRINDPDTRYTLRSMAGEFSALNLLCLMHVGVRSFDPDADTGADLDKEYDVAKAMRGNKQ